MEDHPAAPTESVETATRAPFPDRAHAPLVRRSTAPHHGSDSERQDEAQDHARDWSDEDSRTDTTDETGPDGQTE